MKLSKLIGIAIAAITVAAIAAIPASALLPEFLPNPTGNSISFTGSSGETSLKSELGTVECAKTTGKGQVTNLRLGTFLILFEGCKETKGKTACTGLSDTISGDIDVTGSFHIWTGFLINAGGTVVRHPAVIVFLPNHVHFACTGGIALFLVLGNVGCLIFPVNTLTGLLTFSCKEDEKHTGINDITEVEIEPGEKLALSLKSALNEAKEVASVQAGDGDLTNFTQGGKAIKVEIMA